METIALLICKAREKKGMTQTELGLAIGIESEGAAQVTISKYERGVTVPHANLGKLIEVLGLPREKVMKMMAYEMWSC
jgi:transcriptional regulator with XRE-family HTH domain